MVTKGNFVDYFITMGNTLKLEENLSTEGMVLFELSKLVKLQIERINILETKVAILEKG